MNEIRAVLFSPFQRCNNVLKLVVPLRGISMDFPLDPEIVFGIEVDLHIVAIAHGTGCVTQVDLRR